MLIHWLKSFGRSQRNTAYDAEGNPAERPLQVQRFEAPAMFEQLEPRLLLDGMSGVDEAGTQIQQLSSSSAQFVEAEGLGFRLGGKPFYAPGANNYYLLTYASTDSTRGHVDDVLADAKAMGLKVIRAWGFCDGASQWNALQTAPGQYTETVFRGLDYVIYKAGQLNLRLILPFVNYLTDYGGMDQYVAWDAVYGADPNEVAAERNDFYTDSDTRRWYRNFISAVVNRRNTYTGVLYKNDPTIFSWELANEPRAPGDASGDILQGWLEEMAAYVKSVDSNHMLTTGVEGFYSGQPGNWMYDGSQGTDFIRNHQVAAIDFATVHLYSAKWGLGQDGGMQWYQEHIDDVRDVLHMPLLLEEFGLDGSIDERNALFAGVSDLADRTDSAGWNFWTLADIGYSYDNYSIRFRDLNDASTVRIIRNAAARMNARSANLAFDDFNGDSKADIMWRDPATGKNSIWIMDDTQFKAEGQVKPLGADWHVGGVVDLNGDGKADILWRNTADGRNSIWLMNGTNFVKGVQLPAQPNQNWQVVGVGDFNLDGKADILWRNVATGSLRFWLMDRTKVKSTVNVGGISDPNWKVVGVGDFNGDARPDILWRNRATGANQAWLMSGTTHTGGRALPTEVDQAWQVGPVADYTSDNRNDIWWYNAATGASRLWQMNWTARENIIDLKPVAPKWWPAELPQWAGRLPARDAGRCDFNGDREADILWRDQAAGKNAVWSMRGAASTVIFRDDFNTPGALDPDDWVRNHPEDDDWWWTQGRTHFPHPTDPPTKSRHLPYVEDGHAVIKHEDYNPYDLAATNTTFLGGEIHTVMEFDPSRPYRFEARVRGGPYPDGLVTSFFLYGYDAVNQDSDEIDFEFVSNKTNDDDTYPDGDPVLTNTWDDSKWNDPNEKPIYVAPDGLNLAGWNTFIIYWYPQLYRVDWSWISPVTGEEELLRTETVSHIPDESMSLYFNFWAPDGDLKPVNNPNQNQIYRYEIDYVEARTLPPGQATGDPGEWFIPDPTFIGGKQLKPLGPAWRVGGIGDFNGDHKTDILWRNTTNGKNSVWLMDGAKFVQGLKLPAQPNQNWQVVGIGDFNGDGKNDVLWRNAATDSLRFWMFDGTTYRSTVDIGGIADTNWQVAGVGDFNDDAKTDILWRNVSTGANQAWLMNGTTHTGDVALAAEADQDWQVGSIADYTGDGQDDLWWYNTATGANRLWEMNGAVQADNFVLKPVASKWQPAELRVTGAENPGQTVARYDFNGDGKADILWRDPQTGKNCVWLMNGTEFIGGRQVKSAALKWRIGGVADFNGDGKPDIFWRDRARGKNVVWYMNGTTFAGAKALRSLGSAWRAAGVADFNGDGKADILWRNPATGANVVWYMNRTAYAGSKNIKALAASWQVGGLGDFNADGKTDILWRNAATGQNRVWLMNGPAFSSSEDLPVKVGAAWQVNVADYTGDGKVDILWHEAGADKNQLWEMDGVNLLSEIDLKAVNPKWRLHGIGA